MHLGKNIKQVKFLKSRKAGSEKLIELVLLVNKSMSIGEGHDICNEIEEEIMASLKGARVIIHLEPFRV